jgi:hypothetical protein
MSERMIQRSFAGGTALEPRLFRCRYSVQALVAASAKLGQRLAAAAAVRAMASGSLHRTMRAISHRIARSLLASAPSSSATYRIGAASVSAWDVYAFRNHLKGTVDIINSSSCMLVYTGRIAAVISSSLEASPTERR